MPSTTFNPANLLSMSRILLVPCFFGLCYYTYSGKAPSLVIWCRIVLMVMLLSDFLDGFLARRRREVTVLGSLLDPLADKLFVTASFILLTIFDLLPVWLTMIVVSKDLLVVIGWILVATIQGRVKAIPTETAKWAAAFQFAAITAVVFSIPNSYQFLINITAAILTLLGLSQYVLQGLRLLSTGNGSSGNQA